MASRSIGGIVARLYLADKDFRSKLDRAAKQVSRVTAKMRKDFNRIGRRALLAAGAAAAAFAARVAVAGRQIVALSAHARKLGMLTSELQSMRFVARMNNVEIAALDTGLQRMARRIGEAATGTGTAANTLKRLGLDAQELNKLAPEQQFRAIADAMSLIGSRGEQLAMTMAIFDTEGVGLVEVLAKGSAGIDELDAKLERMGVKLSELDTQKLQDVNAQFVELGVLTDGLWQQFAIGLAPVVSDLMERFLSMADSIGGVGEVANRVLSWIVTGAGWVANVFHGWLVVFESVKVGLFSLSKWNAQVFDSILTIIENGINLAIRNVNKLVEQVNKVLPDSKEIGLVGEFKFDGLRNFTQAAEKVYAEEAEKSLRRFDELVARERPSDKAQKWFQDVTKNADEKARKALEDRAKSDSQAAEEIENLAETVKSVEDKFRMSFDDIAGSGASGSNVKLAQRAQALREKAAEAEAQGRFEAADRYTQRAEELEGRVKRRRESGAEEGGGAAEGEPGATGSTEAPTPGTEIEVLREILAAVKALPESVGAV